MREWHSLAKWPYFLHLKHGPLVQGGGVSVWATFPHTPLHCPPLWDGPPLLLKGALLLDRSIGTGVLFIHLGAFVELYWGNCGGGPLGAGALSAFTSCCDFTMLMALFFRS